MKPNSKRPSEVGLRDFEDALLRSLDQAMSGEGALHTPDQIKARRGRPVGSLKVDKKVPTTIRFDADVLRALKASGRGWQSRVNQAMRDWLQAQSALTGDADQIKQRRRLALEPGIPNRHSLPLPATKPSST